MTLILEVEATRVVEGGFWEAATRVEPDGLLTH